MVQNLSQISSDELLDFLISSSFVYVIKVQNDFLCCKRFELIKVSLKMRV